MTATSAQQSEGLKGALQLRLGDSGDEETVHSWDTPNLSIVSYRLSDASPGDCDFATNAVLGQSPSSSLLGLSDRDGLVALVQRSLMTPMLSSFEESNEGIKAFIDNPQYSKLSFKLQCLFPTLGFRPGIILQSECPIKFPLNETECLLNDNDSQISGLDFAEMDETSSNVPAATEPSPSYQPVQATPAPSGESPTAMSPPSLQRETPSPGETAQSDMSDKSTQMTRLAYCHRIADSAITKLNISSNPQEINQHILSLGSSGGIHALEKEKRRIKFILRKYDLTFEKAFGQPPSRVEKEPMRVVYVYYRKVKLAIDKVAANPVPVAASPEFANSAAGDEQPADGSKKQLTSSSSSLNQAPLEELERKLEKMTTQKVVLAKRLQSFQESFEKRNGRRIRYHRDIVEIDSDYRKYKKLRAHVLQLTETIKARRALLTARGEPASRG
eukprot:Gregarina_sp_Poly_1__10750@NODE_81_length_15589_cov_30_056114_g69_i0_p3_GENE_NODE_81_length_15589_cov_30_056114_g69_i0NODE_81_length_15589_cov_30_056114_g69_i0_p3_ORF_typecomplete_len444_score79_16BEX/PF04538_12/0_0089Myosin_tail_1/PF01576_19/5_8e03Myosin_tail_1/PF01576_19/0_06Snapin_Pallidin/PF14712_6/0_32MscS_porin/PF12795_7/3_5e03MscS_porin/PF12795_7/0_13_NODE_81_length_15589_cov_30_056114_g69_i01132512656